MDFKANFKASHEFFSLFEINFPHIEDLSSLSSTMFV